MRNRTLLIVIFVCTQFTFSQKRNFHKVEKTEDYKVDIEQCLEFVNDYFKKLNANNYYQFKSTEATSAMKTMLTEDVQKSGYNQLMGQFGKFQSVTFSEIWSAPQNSHIYRFKSTFTKSRKKLEVRVVLSKTKKIAGFWIKPWSDVLH